MDLSGIWVWISDLKHRDLGTFISHYLVLTGFYWLLPETCLLSRLQRANRGRNWYLYHYTYKLEANGRRIASFNVENLFSRASAMNLASWSEGKEILAE